MKRILFCLVILSAAADAGAVQPNAPPPGPPSQQRHFRIGSWGTWVRTNGPGYPAYRYTYSGEQYGFPRPAIFTYGYEHEPNFNSPFSLGSR